MKELVNTIHTFEIDPIYSTIWFYTEKDKYEIHCTGLKNYIGWDAIFKEDEFFNGYGHVIINNGEEIFTRLHLLNTGEGFNLYGYSYIMGIDNVDLESETINLKAKLVFALHIPEEYIRKLRAVIQIIQNDMEEKEDGDDKCCEG